MKKSLKFKQKPVVIEALQWTGAIAPFLAFFGDFKDYAVDNGGEKLIISKWEGDMTVDLNAWVIKEAADIVPEFFMCNPQYFKENYTSVEETKECTEKSDREFLWDILDDIDSASDIAKSDDAGYRKAVEVLQKMRFQRTSSDGHTITWNSDAR